MATEPVNYAAVLEDLKARRAALDSAIAAIEPLAALLSAATPPTAGDTALSDDAFFGMCIADAIRKYLSLIKKKKSAREIMDGLIAGGVEHASKNFYNSVYTALAREWSKPDPEIVKIGDSWGLAEWYPGRKFKKKAEESGAPEVPASNGEEPPPDEAKTTTETRATSPRPKPPNFHFLSK